MWERLDAHSQEAFLIFNNVSGESKKELNLPETMLRLTSVGATWEETERYVVIKKPEQFFSYSLKHAELSILFQSVPSHRL